jgi:hypothetical protein
MLEKIGLFQWEFSAGRKLSQTKRKHNLSVFTWRLESRFQVRQFLTRVVLDPDFIMDNPGWDLKNGISGLSVLGGDGRKLPISGTGEFIRDHRVQTVARQTAKGTW